MRRLPTVEGLINSSSLEIADSGKSCWKTLYTHTYRCYRAPSSLTAVGSQSTRPKANLTYIALLASQSAELPVALGTRVHAHPWTAGGSELSPPLVC
jgi:hypothetical protein